MCQKLRILWVEDDDGVTRTGARLMQTVAQKFGVEMMLEVVRTLDDARQRAHGFDCVLLDLDLPGSDTEHTALAIHSLAAEWPPIIVVSGFVYPDEMERDAVHGRQRGMYWRVLKYGADNVFHKGVALENMPMLLDAIRKAVLKRITANMAAAA